ncbi:hypothetical protein [Oceanispirochaeta sp.]|jgi:hypothetical protein|uniref:hypothetical protein n=1 Tax=Oceanispirochaeta sp. TaxID=2035350 RepID=UPI002625F91F|nr:hypothetical protein [Oceanispirochaeta sp.]MDA3958019.1 hypothetical protein [Oceanispirochaeta sp.]
MSKPLNQTSPIDDPLSPENIHARFRQISAPGTGRKAYQLTLGEKFAQALYYFSPLFTEDGRWLVYNQHDVEGDVISHTCWIALDILTGKQHKLAEVAQASGFIHDGESATLNPVRRELIYNTGRTYRTVHIETGEDRHLFDIPPQRKAQVQNCVSPCGRYFFYISHDAEQWRIIKNEGKRPMTDVHIMRYDLDSGEQHLVLRLNAFCKHIIAYGPRHLCLSYDHLPVEHMLLLTDYEGGWYTALRTEIIPENHTCHYNVSRQGLHYEAGGGSIPALGGITCPRTHRRMEFPTPLMKGRHVAAVPDGTRWMTDGLEPAGRVLFSLTDLPSNTPPVWQQLSGPWPTYGTGQKSHGHPRVTPCGRWVLLLGGDPETRTNQLFLLDIQDVPLSRGLPDFAGEAGMDFPV